MIEQAEIHRKANNSNLEDRKEATKLIAYSFSELPDKIQAWKDLIRLIQDEDGFVRRGAADALGAAFSKVPDKDLAWKDLIRLIQEEDGFVRWRAADALGAAFSQVPDKDLAWKDLHMLTQDGDCNTRGSAAGALGAAFSQVPDKDLAWKDLHMLTQDGDCNTRGSAAGALGAAFSQVLDKNLAWKDLHMLTQDEDFLVRGSAAGALGAAFSQVPDKNLAWKDLHMLTQDEEYYVRWGAAGALGAAFSQIPDKDLAWKDLHMLTQDEDSDVRWTSVHALGAAFSQVPDKELAWKDLHKLTQDEENHVRYSVAGALGAAFSQVPDKDLAWKDLHMLTQDEDSNVRKSAAGALGAAFSQVPDKDLVWKDLHMLTQDEDSDVRMYAYHASGRVSIFKATTADNETTLKREFEAAVKYFERSSQESQYSPASFCYPFYRTYYAITFRGAKNDEVQKYLAKAKNAVEGSESKVDLLKAIENLAGALQEAQRLKEKSILEIASDLNAYRWYCENAADNMKAAEESAPGAVKLMRRCNPLLEGRIRAIIAEIQKSARKICKITHGSGTEYEAPGAELQKAAKGLSTGDLYSVQNYSSKIVWQLKKFCGLLPPDDKEQVCSIVEEISQEADFPEKLHKILTAILCLRPILEGKSTSFRNEAVTGETLQRIEAKLDVIHDNTKHLDLYLSNIEFTILKLKDSSGNAKKHLLDIKNEIDKLQSEIEAQGLSEKELVIALEDKDHALIERLAQMQENISRAVRDTVKLNASKRDLEELLNELEEQDKLKKRDALGIISDISQLLQIAMNVYLTGSII